MRHATCDMQAMLETATELQPYLPALTAAGGAKVDLFELRLHADTPTLWQVVIFWMLSFRAASVHLSGREFLKACHAAGMKG